MTYTNGSLAEILAQIVQFSQNLYQPIQSDTVYPEDVAENCAYTCACFIAQHTQHGNEGVELEVAYRGLKVNEWLSYSERVLLAQDIIRKYGGEK